MTLIQIDAVSKAYRGESILSAVSFQVQSGEVVAIVGKNGAGKSTLLSIIAAMLKPDGGRVLFDGKSAFTDRKTAKRIGFMPQSDSLFEELTVADNLTFWASAAKALQTPIGQNPYVRLMGLDGLLHKRIHALSGGMRRRAAVCIALLHNPDFIILDEPFTGLDLIYQQELRDCLKALREMGKTIVYTTHSGEELVSLSNRVVIIHNKTVHIEETERILQEGASAQDTLTKLIKGEKLHD